MIDSVEDILRQPELLRGLRPADIRRVIERATEAGWEEGTLRRGSRAGEGFVLRELRAGRFTGRTIQWHPGSGHHGAPPYWKVSGPEIGTVRVGPQFGRGVRKW